MIGAVILGLTVLATVGGVVLARRSIRAPAYALKTDPIDVDVFYVRGPISGGPSELDPDPVLYPPTDIADALVCLRDALAAQTPPFPEAWKGALAFTLEIRRESDSTAVDGRMNGWTDTFRPTAFSARRRRITIRQLRREPIGLLHIAQTALFHEVCEHALPMALGLGTNAEHADPQWLPLTRNAQAVWRARQG